jgi:iron complex outermembrane receptor protein
VVSIDGNSLPNAPEWIFNATLRAAVPAGDAGEVYLFTDWAYRDEVTVGETEKIISYEIGTKANLGRRARANLAIFYYTMNDQQLTAVGGEANVTRLVNADKTEGQGFELEFDWLPHDQLFFTLGTSYNKTEIKDPYLGVIPGAAAGLTVLDPELEAGTGIVSIDGNSLPNAPEWIFNGTLRGALPAGDAGEVYLFTDWSYKDKVSFFLYESTEFMPDGYVEGGLRIGYTTYDNTWDFALWGRNITDTLARTGGIDFNNLTGFVNEPRTVGLEARYRF